MLRFLDPKRAASGIWWNRCLAVNKGCSKVSPGCAHCWSEGESHLHAGNPAAFAQRRWGGVTDDEGRWTGKAVPLPESLEKLTKRHKPTVWSVWNDLFHYDMTDAYIWEVFRHIAACPEDTFIVLTKRPGRMQQLGDQVLQVYPLPNVIWCVSAEDQTRLDERAGDLVRMADGVPGFGRKRMVGLHLAPLLGPVDLGNLAWTYGGVASPHSHIHWVVVEGESGPGARPMEADWARSVRDLCVAADVPFWFKNWGPRGAGRELDGRTWDEYPIKEEEPK
jgi:protein gp37